MALKDTYDSLDDIDEPFRELYSERDGKFELTGITGIKTTADVTRVQASLTKERSDHKATKVKLGLWGELDHADVMTKLDSISELEAAANGKLDQAQIDEIVERRMKTKMAPHDRELSLARETIETQGGEITGFKSANSNRKITDALRKVLTKAQVLPGAMEDAMLYVGVFEIREDDGAVVTRENAGVTPGLDPGSWYAEIQDSKRHWLGESKGGGSRGSRGGGGVGGANPFADETWNFTKQSLYVKEHGMEKAELRAKAAGTTVGGPRPKSKKG